MYSYFYKCGVILLPKKGDLGITKNYRVIKLNAVTDKIYTKWYIALTKNKLKQLVSQHL